MPKTIITTEQAPKAIGTYSQAVKVGHVVYLSGQIPLDPASMTIVSTDIAAQTEQTFKNLQAVCQAAGGSLADLVKITIYLIDLNDFTVVNEVMAKYFDQPYPARATIEVSKLPKAVLIEIDGIVCLPEQSR